MYARNPVFGVICAFGTVGTTGFWKLVYYKQQDTAPFSPSPAGLDLFGAGCAYTGWSCIAFEQQTLSKISCLAHLMETVRARYRVLDNFSCSSAICRQQLVCWIWRAEPCSQGFYLSNSNMNWRAKKRTFEGYLLPKFRIHTMYGIRSAFICCRRSILLFPIWNFQIGTSELLPRTANINTTE